MTDDCAGMYGGQHCGCRARWRSAAERVRELEAALRDCYECLREGEEFPCVMHPDLWPRIEGILAAREETPV